MSEQATFTPMDVTLAIEDAAPELTHLFTEPPTHESVGTTGAITRRGQIVHPGGVYVPVAAMADLLRWASTYPERAAELVAVLNGDAS